MSEDELMRETVREFGGQKLGSRSKAAMLAALEILEARGVCDRVEGGVTLRPC